MPPTKTGKNLQCKNCGNKIYVPKWKLKRNQNHFCDKQCYDNFQTNTVQKSCQYCGDSILDIPSEIGKFCSIECYGKSKTEDGTVEYNCDYCDRSFKIHKYRTKNQENCFCSDKCTSKWRAEEFSGKNNPKFNGGKYRGFGNNWLEVRESVWRRADGNCEWCNKTNTENGSRLSVHHIIPRRKFINHNTLSVEDSNYMKNLIALCQSCHSSAEAGNSCYPSNNEQ
jgi:5-methylcytosine-specific restriction endonuclease McrA